MLNYSPESNSSKIILNQLAYRLKVLAEPNRMLIINLLMEGIQCNCELGDHLQIAPNLISHHLRVLRESGLIDIERDPRDARWIYYSINLEALEALNHAWETFFDPKRIKSRSLTCGPHGALLQIDAKEYRKYIDQNNET